MRYQVSVLDGVDFAEYSTGDHGNMAQEAKAWSTGLANP